MSHHSRPHVALVAIVAVLLPATAAQAQLYGTAPAQPAPLYPYAVQPSQSYAVEVAPNTYVIQRAARSHSYPYVGPAREPRIIRSDAPRARESDRPVKRNDRALIEELRQRHSVKREIINTKKIVYDKPVVIETKRIVDDPPRIIERRHYVEDAPSAAAKRGPRGKQAAVAVNEREPSNRPRRDDNKKRVIEADAEVTILGPDRMSIRLFRKGNRGAAANASASAD